MRFGLNLANFGLLADVRAHLELALAAEEAGWDGYFIYDDINMPGFRAHADPWITLGVIASRTERLRLGTSVTPVPRRRPTKLAREILTLDALSGGRFIFGAGNGMISEEFEHLGDEGDLRIRSEMLEEGLQLIRALCTDDDEVEFSGRHYQVNTKGFGAPASGARIPIWLGATWPKQRPVRRAARFDGIIPILDPYTDLISPDQIRDLVAFIAANRETAEPFEVVIPQMGQTGDEERDRDQMRAYAGAGATWVLDAADPAAEGIEGILARVRLGPPRID
jgi:alkanesulfonate monooxygenase SsuD/methylene tetrahydromethanopterin reductase-like flavin-dependent oxidoreductase (luciferase family)